MHEVGSSMTGGLSDCEICILIFVSLSGVWSLYLESVSVYVWSLYLFQLVADANGALFCFLKMECMTV